MTDRDAGAQRSRISPKKQQAGSRKQHTDQAPALPPLPGLSKYGSKMREMSRLATNANLLGRAKAKKAQTPAELANEWQRQRADRAKKFKPRATTLITNEQLQHAKSAFFSIDRDGSGSIDEDELTVCLKTLGLAPSKEDIERIMGNSDNDGNRSIDLREFLDYYAEGLSPVTHQEQAEQDLKNLHIALGNGREDISKTKLQEMLKEQFDMDVDIDELFKAVWKKGKTATLDELEAGLDDKLTLPELKRVFLDANGPAPIEGPA